MSTLSPFDLLSLSADEQNILRCLTKTPQLTSFEIADKVNLPLLQVEEILNLLVQQAKAVEQLQNGERVFSTRFQFKRQAVRNMPGEILNLYEQPADQFLAETPLTAGLSTEAAKQLLALSQTRVLLPDEVLAWQGQKLDGVYLIQRGLLTSTRLQSRFNSTKGDYKYRAEWLGIPEVLSDSKLAATVTAVTDTTLLVWPIQAFLEFTRANCDFALAVATYLSQQVKTCQRSQSRSQNKLWVVDGVHAGAGVTTMAFNLARLAQMNQSDQKRTAQTLFWPVGSQNKYFHSQTAPKSAYKKVGLAEIATNADGLDILVNIRPNSYGPQVQLDILLADLQARYEYIICDSGSHTQNELELRLRGQAQTLITLTRDGRGAEAGISRWHSLQPYSYPGQKRVLALNGANQSVVEVDPKFHLVIPLDSSITAGNQTEQTPIITAKDSPLAHILQEVYRRLSLNHTLALFVPSTLDVDQTADNSAQVQETLSFMGNLFGGATSSNAEGAWRSEDSGLVTEQVTIVRTFVSKKAIDSHLDDVLSYASALKEAMKQEAVAISVDNQLILV